MLKIFIGMKEQLEENGFNYYFSDDKMVFFIIANGEVNYNQCVQMMDTLVSHRFFSKNTTLIADLRDVDYHPAHNEFMNLVEHMKSLKDDLKDCKMALVCSPLLFSLGYLVCEIMSMFDYNMKTFLKLESAEEWIDKKLKGAL